MQEYPKCLYINRDIPGTDKVFGVSAWMGLAEDEAEQQAMIDAGFHLTAEEALNPTPIVSHDDLTVIKGVGGSKQSKLVKAGFLTYSSIADMTDEERERYGISDEMAEQSLALATSDDNGN